MAAIGDSGGKPKSPDSGHDDEHATGELRSDDKQHTGGEGVKLLLSQHDAKEQEDINKYILEVERLLATHRERELKLWVQAQNALTRHGRAVDDHFIEKQDDVFDQYHCDLLRSAHDTRQRKQELQVQLGKILNNNKVDIENRVRHMVQTRRAREKGFHCDLVNTFRDSISETLRKCDAHFTSHIEDVVATALQKKKQDAFMLEARTAAEDAVENRIESVIAADTARWAEKTLFELDVAETEVKQRFEGPIGELKDQLHKALKGSRLDDKDEEDVFWEKFKACLSETSLRVIGDRKPHVLMLEQYAREAFLFYETQMQSIIDQEMTEKMESFDELRKIKIAMCKWRLDYEEHAQSAHEEKRALLTHFEKTTFAEDTLFPLTGEDTIVHPTGDSDSSNGVSTHTVSVSGPSLHTATRSAASKTVSTRVTRMLEDFTSKRAPTRRMHHLQRTVRGLWNSLSVPTEEINDFIEGLQREFPSELEAILVPIYEEETKRLSAQFAIAQALTERELVEKHAHLREKGKLRAIDRQLAKLQEEYRKSYGTFYYKGEIYGKAKADDDGVSLLTNALQSRDAT